MGRIKGIDVSEHQGLINWRAVKNDGIKFAIIRAGWGEINHPTGGEMDSRAFENISGALSAGLEIGLYVYSYAQNVNEALQEANFIKTVLDQFPKELFSVGIFIDVEDEKYQGDVDINPLIDAFCTEIKNHGYKAGYYCNLNWYQNRVNQAIKDKWELFWLAQYNDTASVTSSIWQCSSTGSVSGINGNVDLNISNIDFADDSPNQLFDIIHPPANSSSGMVDIGVEYQVFIQGYGWTPVSRDGYFSGSMGFSGQIEKIKVRLVGADKRDIHIHCNLHIQDVGWAGFAAGGQENGIEGKRVEGIQLQLTGSDADQYSIQYRVHSQNIGTMDFAKDGELAGSEGGNLRAEAIQILITKKDVDLSQYEVDSFKHFEPKPSPDPETTHDGNYFGPNEFKCECGCGGDVVQELKDLANRVRKMYGHPLYISSGFRCDYQNKKDGGVPNSNHKIGHAADMYSPGRMSSHEVDVIADCIKACGGGVIMYHSNLFCHMELSNAFWSMN